MPKMLQRRAAFCWYLGIDPGSSSGGAAVVDQLGKPATRPNGLPWWIRFDKCTDHEIIHWMRTIELESKGHLVAAIERVHSMPGQGVSATFKFGQSYGFLRGCLVGLNISIGENPAPHIWQRDMNCLTKGDKKISRSKAQSLWPKYTDLINHHVADALLLAEWLRRKEIGLVTSKKRA